MSTYPKTQTLWKRNLEDKSQILVGQYSFDEFGNIKLWEVDEKIDGTNVRIYYTPTIQHPDTTVILGSVKYMGRTEKSEIEEQGNLLEYLKKKFPFEVLEKEFGEKETLLYGEGIGPKIGAFGKEIFPEAEFVLFDVVIGKWWLQRDAIKDIAGRLEINFAPNLGVMTEEEIIEHIKSKPKSVFAMETQNKEIQSEGIVARPYPAMMFRNGNPIAMKLKVTDYIKLKSND